MSDPSKGGGIGADFWLLWSGQFISRLGSAMSVIAVPLIAVNTLKATSFEMGALGAVQSLPTVLLAVAGGVLADRVSKRMIMLTTEAGRALVLMAIGGAVATGHLTMSWLYGLAFIASALGVFFDVSYSALIPVLVDRSRLLNANTAIQGARTASSLAGRSIGGVVVATMSASAAMYSDAISYVVSFLSILLVRWQEPRQVRETRQTSISVDVVEGFRFIRAHPHIRALLAYAASSNFSISALFAIYVLYLSADLHLSAAQVGLVLAMLACGSLIGALITPRLTRLLGYGLILRIAGLVASGGAWVLIFSGGTAIRTMLLQSAGLAILGASLTVININISALTQAVTPPQLMARVVGATQFVCSIMLPVGALTSGVVGQYAGARTAVMLVAVGLMGTAILFHLSQISKFKVIPAAEGDTGEVL